MIDLAELKRLLAVPNGTDIVLTREVCRELIAAAEQKNGILDGSMPRERLIRDGFAFDSDRDCDAARYLIGVIDVLRWDRNLLRQRAEAAERERDALLAELDRFSELVARMHGRVVGMGNCPIHGVVEDIEDVVAERNTLKAEVERFRRAAINSGGYQPAPPEQEGS